MKRMSAKTLALDLRSFLAKKLPEYLVPSAIVLMDSLPLTPNGKVERNLLPKPEPARPEIDRPFAPPRTPLELTIAKIWEQVLGIEQVGINDNFFEIGGTSLKAVQVIAHLRKHLGAEISAASIFANYTISALAQALSGNNSPAYERAASSQKRGIDRRVRKLARRAHLDTRRVKSRGSADGPPS